MRINFGGAIKRANVNRLTWLEDQQKIISVPPDEDVYLGKQVLDVDPPGISHVSEIEGIVQQIEEDLEKGVIPRGKFNGRLMRLRWLVQRSKKGELATKKAKLEALSFVNKARDKYKMKKVSLFINNLALIIITPDNEFYDKYYVYFRQLFNVLLKKMADIIDWHRYDDLLDIYFKDGVDHLGKGDKYNSKFLVALIALIITESIEESAKKADEYIKKHGLENEEERSIINESMQKINNQLIEAALDEFMLGSGEELLHALTLFETAVSSYPNSQGKNYMPNVWTAMALKNYFMTISELQMDEIEKSGSSDMSLYLSDLVDEEGMEHLANTIDNLMKTKKKEIAVLIKQLLETDLDQDEREMLEGRLKEMLPEKYQELSLQTLLYDQEGREDREALVLDYPELKAILE